MRRAGVAAALVVATVLLAGCATIPTSGDVQAGPTQAADAPEVVLVPAAPARGETQLQIVQGFIAAAAGQQNGYAIARKFLTPAFAKTWKPRARVLVHEDSLTYRQGAPTAVTASVPATAQVDASGAFAMLPAPQPTALRFTLARIAGEWRIDHAPDGVVLGQDYFGHVFQTRAVQYFTPDYEREVPDLRWFPVGRLSPTDVVKALLAGPAAPIRPPVVATAFPHGTRTAGVDVTNGVATVALRTGAAVPSKQVLQRMKTQLVDTLTGLDGIAQVQLSVNGANLAVVGSSLRPSGPAAAPLVLRGSTLGYLAGSRLTAETTLGPRLVDLKPAAVTISTRQHLAAVLGSAGVSVVTPTGSTVVDKGSDLVAPTLDQDGWTYSASRSDPTQLGAFDTKGHQSQLLTGLTTTASNELNAIEVSPDGTRMLVLSQGDDGPKAFVAGIVRGSDGTPTGLTDARYPVTLPAGTAIDATWVDTGSVAVLESDPNGDQMTLQSLGGEARPLGRLQNAVAVVGGSGQDDLRALLSNGDLAQLDNGVWQALQPSTDAALLAVQR
ncbi:LpqB family beta-propeller domain-containing protein [Amnibacterium sp. CER49]|uniref:LpqB family beta-propeller domain-containing protein n=1 Tax=Amnibacterium sp. CER49 TaxID=3039161 RepID=UPI002449ECD8|nr:LpqB family beta-propeller domain-containing protein [Amnibacterium sp. CER49]MDH2442950.1 LpqB family beta-propeller domain-containing protein [Amnibacterium sp. CER49]